MRKRRGRKALRQLSTTINNFGRSVSNKTRPARQNVKNTARQAFDRSRLGRDVHSVNVKRGKDGRARSMTQVSSRGQHTPKERRQLHIDAARRRTEEERAERQRRIAERERGRTERERGRTERNNRQRPEQTRNRGRT